MQKLQCENCGSVDFEEEGGIYFCAFCGTKYIREDQSGTYHAESQIALRDDVKILLQKWRKNPEKADQYAALILQMDPYNTKANEYEQSKTSSKKSGCYIATAVYGNYDSPPVWTLRRFRDDFMAKTAIGQLFIQFYYQTSPFLVRHFGRISLVKKCWKKILDSFVGWLNERGVPDTPYKDRDWI